MGSTVTGARARGGQAENQMCSRAGAKFCLVSLRALSNLRSLSLIPFRTNPRLLSPPPLSHLALAKSGVRRRSLSPGSPSPAYARSGALPSPCLHSPFGLPRPSSYWRCSPSCVIRRQRRRRRTPFP